MVEAATHALSNRQLGTFSIGIARRRGTKIACVALARRLLTLVFYALRDEGGCRAFPVLHNPRSSRGRACSPHVMAPSRGRPPV